MSLIDVWRFFLNHTYYINEFTVPLGVEVFGFVSVCIFSTTETINF